MRTVALVVACLACAGYARRVKSSIDQRMLIDSMTQDPQSQEQMRQATSSEVVAHPYQPAEVMSQSYQPAEVITQPYLATEVIPSEIVSMGATEAYSQQALTNLLFRKRSSSNTGGLRSLASLALDSGPRHRRASATSKHRRKSKQEIMAEAQAAEREIVIGAAGAGGFLGVWLTSDVGTAMMLSALAAYSTTLDNGLGRASKKFGSYGVKAYDKVLDLNEQYDILGKAKGTVDRVVGVAGNVDKRMNLSGNIEETLHLSAAIGKAAERIGELKNKTNILR